MTQPTTYTPELGARICELISLGKSLPKALAMLREENPTMYLPDRCTVYAWRNHYEDFRGMYDRAREQQAESLIDEMVDISDTADDRDSSAAARVRVDARRVVAEKLFPKRWGVRQTVVGDRNADPIQTEGTLQVTILRDPPAGHAE